MKKVITGILLCSLTAAMLFGCRVNISVGTNDTLTCETYPNAEKYKIGAFTYNAADIKAVEVYWRSGEVEIVESDDSELHVKESGSELSDNAAMHYLLDGDVLRVRFCASGAKICVDSSDKHLRLEVPKNISLSVHATSAAVKADLPEQKSVLLSLHSGETRLGTVVAENVDLSSSSGAISAHAISAESLKCSASSGSITLESVSAGRLACTASSGDIDINNIRAETAEVSASSGEVKLTFEEACDAAVRTTSGNVAIAPARSGAKLSYISNSGKLLTSRSYERSGNLYVFGEGAGGITVETSSGSLEIR